MDGSSDDFDTKKAEVFEALSHPIRIKILMALEARPLSFSQLKQVTQMSSSGQMTFHLSKLADLIRTTEDGTYTLSAEGIEAVHFVVSTLGREGPAFSFPRRDAVVRGLIVSLVILGAAFLLMGLYLNGQTSYGTYNASGFCCNETIPPGHVYLGSGQGVISQSESANALWIAQPWNSGLQFEVVLFPAPYNGPCGLCSSLPANSTVVGISGGSTALNPSEAAPSFSAGIDFGAPPSYYAVEAFVNPTTQNITLQSYIVEWQSPIAHPYSQISGQFMVGGAILLIVGGLGAVLYSPPGRRVVVPIGSRTRDWYREQKAKQSN